MFSVTQIQEHLTGMGHGGTLNKVRNIYAMFERSASRFLLKVHPLESIRAQALTNAIYDDVYNYTLPSDFGLLVDLIPQDNRQLWDTAFRNQSGQFDIQKATRNRTIAIEGNNGIKVIRINWRSRTPKVLNSMNSLAGNGTWAAVGSATGVALDTIFKVASGGSIVFNHVVTGDGIQNSTMNAVDLTNENGVSTQFVWVYFSTVPTTGITATSIWGNNLTTKYWTSAGVTTAFDGSAFKVGWNLLGFPWVAATQTAGIVLPASINSSKITFASATALGKVRVDNVVFAIGRNFDIKYYSKYLFLDHATSLWISRPADPSDNVAVDNDTLPLFLMECLTDMAQQMEGTDSAFDIKFAEQQLLALYPIYKGMNPSMVKKTIGSYGGAPRYGAASSNRFKR